MPKTKAEYQAEWVKNMNLDSERARKVNEVFALLREYDRKMDERKRRIENGDYDA
jgi:hypothetical protein